MWTVSLWTFWEGVTQSRSTTVMPSTSAYWDCHADLRVSNLYYNSPTADEVSRRIKRAAEIKRLKKAGQEVDEFPFVINSHGYSHKYPKSCWYVEMSTAVTVGEAAQAIGIEFGRHMTIFSMTFKEYDSKFHRTVLGDDGNPVRTPV